jgi:hypothetical protein
VIWPIILAVAAIIAVVVIAAVLLHQALTDSRADADQNFGTNPVGCATAGCPLKDKGKVTLVEIVEVLTRADEGSVTGATAASGKLKAHTNRAGKNGGAYKQYVNLDKDLEGVPKRHPEYARYIEVKARVEVQGGALESRSVKFSYELIKGKFRPAALTGAPAEGFGSAGGAATHTGTTNAEGWTETVKFYLSQYAGDQFKIAAEAADDPGNKKQTAAYEVWRKFWYQTTRAQTHAVPAPAKSVTAYDKICAEMLKAEEVTFTKADTPAKTFYPGWMVKTGGGDAEESVIGGHNREEFYTKFKAEADKPVKGHLIICQHQWDPFGESDLLTVDVNKNPSDELTLNLGGAWNAGVLTPALSGDLVVVGTWSRGDKNGNLTADNIVIAKGRSALDRVKVKLPADAPDPSTGAVSVQLKLRYGKFYAGESNAHQMLIKHDGSEPKLTQVVSHEFGHGFGQTPRDGQQAAPLAKHGKQYSNEHGGVGSHCKTDSTEVADAHVTSGIRYQGGTCIMFHQVNPEGCKQVFCDTCEPYLRLRDFSAITAAA